MAIYGGIEAGGTKFVCAVGTGPQDLRDEFRFPTTSPDETLNVVIDYFRKHLKKTPLQAIGIGSFGPLNLNKETPDYGSITSTPKIQWQNVNIYRMISEALQIPVGFDTDVNGAALGEYRWGAAEGLTDFIYLTIGTGIGGGGMVKGELLHGLMHPEMGHIFIPHDRQKDPFPGVCPYHQNCFEGLASGPAMKARWGTEPKLLDAEHSAWDLEAQYLALALANYSCTLSPQRIIIGGGVMEQKNLLLKVQKNVKKLLNNYIDIPQINRDIKDYIVLPKLGNQAGILGAIALAERKISAIQRE
jgi:fructokinase